MFDLRALARAAVATSTLWLVACGYSETPGDSDEGAGEIPDDGDPGAAPEQAAPTSFEVKLIRESGTGKQRVIFAIPLQSGALANADLVKIIAGATELPAARRPLARHPDGSVRSVQIQVDADPAVTPVLKIALGSAGKGGVSPVDVDTTLVGDGGDRVPRVWAVLPADALSASGIAGALVPRAASAGKPEDGWTALCDYDRWDTDAFLAGSSSRDVWLYDRVTAMYRGYAVTGELGPLRSAYREAGIYRAGIAISNGTATRIGVPTAEDDLKYHYSQGLALHYLLTGDDRYREAAEAIAARVASMWDPHYDGGDQFWTERHAGFALLAHEWAARVSDDRAATFAARADEAVAAFLETQGASPEGEPETRCFAHTATAHGEDFGTVGCSPWMSAILADGLDAYATRVGGTKAATARTALARLGRSIAHHGRDSAGRPYYWLAVEGAPELDEYDEHWGESAYVTALAWNAAGRTDAALRRATDELITGLRSRGEVGQLRSFNWQCRSAVMTPALLR